jgi:hypothetical protein
MTRKPGTGGLWMTGGARFLMLFQPVSAAELVAHYAQVRRRMMSPITPVRSRSPQAQGESRPADDSHGDQPHHEGAGTNPSEHRLTVKDIVFAASHVTGLAAAAIAGPRRSNPLCLVRHAVMYLAYEMIQSASLPQIGRALGNKDHTTILHGVRRVRQRLEDGDEAMALLVVRIKNMIEENANA